MWKFWFRARERWHRQTVTVWQIDWETERQAGSLQRRLLRYPDLAFFPFLTFSLSLSLYSCCYSSEQKLPSLLLFSVQTEIMNQNYAEGERNTDKTSQVVEVGEMWWSAGRRWRWWKKFEKSLKNVMQKIWMMRNYKNPMLFTPKSAQHWNKANPPPTHPLPVSPFPSFLAAVWRLSQPAKCSWPGQHGGVGTSVGNVYTIQSSEAATHSLNCFLFTVKLRYLQRACAPCRGWQVCCAGARRLCIIKLIHCWIKQEGSFQSYAETCGSCVTLTASPTISAIIKESLELQTDPWGSAPKAVCL